ncbi:hypothetical protein HRH59_18275 [Rheinheimera sp. YQF-2]|uniref:Uncharacterized protein n=1 Tax=Rheinheimera lutimaris TaxID=2740584 RepID=A0A7Y5EJC4_9GAMM|nr:hypothetical protein [Rheinheimera lutimaris]NRQ44490.1 hypothetical protein [Rheinheimera lutimaris]
MKRKLIKRNKARIANQLQLTRLKDLITPVEANLVTYDSISESKLRGQHCHYRRINRQVKLNPRQLKKLRQKQCLAGLLGSKFGGISKTTLKPASAVFLKNSVKG